MKRKNNKLRIVILAAGLGKRMKSDRAKVLHTIGGKPMLIHVLKAAGRLNPEQTIIVIGKQADTVREILAGEKVRIVLQEKQLGTAHAVLQAEKYLRGFQGTLLVLNGDIPLITPETLRAVIREHQKSSSDLTVLTTVVDDPSGYGRVLRNHEGRVTEIVEHRDATESQKDVREINSGIYCAETRSFMAATRKVRTDNVQKEYYLPDAVKILLEEGKKVSAYLYMESEEVLGINTRQELSAAAKLMNKKTISRLMDSGVSIIDPETTFIDSGATVGKDTIIYPNVQIEGKSRIGNGCKILPGVHIADSRIGNGSRLLNHSVITKSTVGRNVQIGPFAHLRPDSEIGDNARIGNFVEVKKSKIGKGAKASHLTYLGDSRIGSGSNIGAGTITCNYDGVKKYQTRLGNNVFVGSDVQFIAPVKVGNGAYIGAGSTITSDVPKNALALARARQTVIRNWVTKKKRKK